MKVRYEKWMKLGERERVREREREMDIAKQENMWEIVRDGETPGETFKYIKKQIDRGNECDIDNGEKSECVREKEGDRQTEKKGIEKKTIWDLAEKNN